MKLARQTFTLGLFLFAIWCVVLLRSGNVSRGLDELPPAQEATTPLTHLPAVHIPAESMDPTLPHVFLRVFGLLGDDASVTPSTAAWRHRYPTWNERWVNASDSRRLITNVLKNNAKALERYDALLPIQKCDIARYVALYMHGGVYLDTDVAPGPHDIHELLNARMKKKTTVLVFEEAVLSKGEAAEVGEAHPIRHGLPEDTQRIANYFFAAKPRDVFWMDVLEEVWRRVDVTPWVSEDYDVLYTTGPDAVTTVVHRSVHPGVVTILRPEDQKYFRHEARGSWRRD